MYTECMYVIAHNQRAHALHTRPHHSLIRLYINCLSAKNTSSNGHACSWSTDILSRTLLSNHICDRTHTLSRLVHFLRCLQARCVFDIDGTRALAAWTHLLYHKSVQTRIHNTLLTPPPQMHFCTHFTLPNKETWKMLESLDKLHAFYNVFFYF